MPSKNEIKQYLENGYYHLYNRGVEKRKIFLDDQDFKVFLSYLKEYLEPIDKQTLLKQQYLVHYIQRDKIAKQLRRNNFSDNINLLAYCLMPNHFHLLIRQNMARGIESFMKSLLTRYVMYFNKKYKRIGGLFQSTYKAVLIKTDEQLLYLSRYIHLNPPYQGLSLLENAYSSLGNYLGKWGTKWVKPKSILDFFSKTNKNLSYEAFVLEKNLADSEAIIQELTIE